MRINRRGFLNTLGSAALATTLCPTPSWAAQSASRPNMIVVLTDDQGYGELACHGNPYIKTPHQDQLHRESVRLTNFHVSPTCAPTRASLMTGRHEFKSGITHTILERERLSLQSVTLAQVLRDAGYTTGIFGKWHLGDEDDYQPGRRGFDEVYIHGGGGIGQTYPGSCGDAPGNTYFNPTLRHNGTFVKTEGYCTDLFFGQTIKWIDTVRKSNQPFLAWIATNAPHAPLQCPESYRKPYLEAGLKPDTASYYGMIANIDDNLGRLRRQLADWKLDRNTLLIFMTDNGHTSPGVYNAEMRGAKGSVWEGGTRVPAFFYWPDRLTGGRDCDKLTAHVDLLPTLAELAGATIPNPEKLDGRSLVPLLDNPQADWPDRILVTHVGRWARGKAAQSQYKNCAIRNTRYKLVNNSELYDLIDDPGEKQNVAGQHPEVVAKLRRDYDRWWQEIQPCLVNEEVTGPAVNPFKAAYWKQFGGGPETGAAKSS